MTEPYRRGNLSIGPLSAKGAAKHQPLSGRVDLSDVAIPHRNSSMKQPYIPKDSTVYRDNSVDESRPRIRGVL